MPQEYTPSGSTATFTVPILADVADAELMAKNLADDISTQFSTSTKVETISNKTLGGDLAAGGFKVTGLADPAANQDAATKAYVVSQTAGSVAAAAGSLLPLRVLLRCGFRICCGRVCVSSGWLRVSCGRFC